MNYIYDITLNLNKNKTYEFYEWTDEDYIEFILKIPVFRVDKDTFLAFKNSDVVIDKKILNQIEDKTETYSPNSIGIIRYACVFSCDEASLAVEFDSDGNSYMKSNISIEEENEILDVCKNLKYTMIEYKIKKYMKIKDKISTRKEEKIKIRVLSILKNIKYNNEKNKLRYMYYEVYGQKEDDIDKVYSKLINLVNIHGDKFSKLNEIINLMDNKKIMSNNS